jgi:hypothetical protein
MLKYRQLSLITSLLLLGVLFTTGCRIDATQPSPVRDTASIGGLKGGPRPTLRTGGYIVEYRDSLVGAVIGGHVDKTFRVGEMSAQFTMMRLYAGYAAPDTITGKFVDPDTVFIGIRDTVDPYGNLYYSSSTFGMGLMWWPIDFKRNSVRIMRTIDTLINVSGDSTELWPLHFVGGVRHLNDTMLVLKDTSLRCAAFELNGTMELKRNGVSRKRVVRQTLYYTNWIQFFVRFDTFLTDTDSSGATFKAHIIRSYIRN